MSREATIDLGYRPRDVFTPYHKRKERWSCIIAHRRCGKTVGCIADLIAAALECDKQRPQYGYVAPTYTQAKDVAWAYLKEYTANLPGVEQRESDLTVNLPTGGRIKLYGADNYDRMRGLYFDGVVLDEFGDIDPRAWSEVIRPALSDRQGWATFIGTPKGRNRFFEIYRQAQEDPEWFSMVLRASETGIIPETELKDAKRQLTPDQYRQEYECSFDAAVIGAYFASLIEEAESDARVCSVPYDPAALVFAGWDLGIGDATAIWFAQVVGREIHLIDYLEASGQQLGWYVDQIKAKPYRVEKLILPHDADARELQTGKSRKEFLQGMGFDCEVLPRHNVDDGINAVRLALPRMWFDKQKTQDGLDAARMYRAEWDDKRKVLRDHPHHDWASHGADALRTLIMGLNEDEMTRPQMFEMSSPSQEWVV